MRRIGRIDLRIARDAQQCQPFGAAVDAQQHDGVRPVAGFVRSGKQDRRAAVAARAEGLLCLRLLGQQQHHADDERKQHKQNEQELAESAGEAVFFLLFGRLGIIAGFRYGAVPARLLLAARRTLRLPAGALRLAARRLVVVLLHRAEIGRRLLPALRGCAAAEVGVIGMDHGAGDGILLPPRRLLRLQRRVLAVLIQLISKAALIGIVRVVPVIQNFADVAQQVLVVLSGLISRVHRDTPFLSLFYTSFRPM